LKSKYDAVVIGAGLGGIAIALRLNKIGQSVLVVEKNQRHGGKLEALEWEGYRWDKGPSLFTLPEQVDELFELFGKDPRKFFNYKKIDNSCHYYFNDGTNFLLKANAEERNEDLIKHFYERDGQAAAEYINEAEKTYESIGELFIDHAKYSLKNVFDKALIKKYPMLLSRKVRGSLNALNRDKFEHHNLIQLFDRYATYNGSDPFQASGLYSMIAHLELNNGTYFPTKGMRSIVDSLYELAIEQGNDFSFNQAAVTVENRGEVYNVQLQENNCEANRIISAIDCVTFYKNVLKDERLTAKYAKKERSSSAIVFYWAVEKIIPELKLHNILFSANYENEFNSIFKFKEMPTSPTIYLHVSSVINPSDAPENGQNWFLMVNTPAGVVPTDEQKEKLRNLIHLLIKEKFGVDISNAIKHEKLWDAKGIEADTGSYQGALYGAASNGKLAALTRHGNTSKKHKKLILLAARFTQVVEYRLY
jgi:phytoene desaturase